MPNRRSRTDRPRGDELILDTPDETTLLDMLDKLLNKGVALHGDIVLGVAGVDLVYLRLSSLLCAVDRVSSSTAGTPKRRHNRGPRKLRSSR